ncbi:PDZ domain-containing protein [Chondromyces apiculatus]|nr:PDZ domain-containing protein [Chondromyces apiculatus]
MPRFPAPLTLLALTLLLGGCREDSGQARAQGRPPPAASPPATPPVARLRPEQRDLLAPAALGTSTSRSRAPSTAWPTAWPQPSLMAGMTPPPPPPQLWDVGDPWALSAIDTGGNGAEIRQIQTQSIALPVLELGDVILRVNDQPVADTEQLARCLRGISPGALAVLTVRRDDAIQHFLVDVPRSRSR